MPLANRPITPRETEYFRLRSEALIALDDGDVARMYALLDAADRARVGKAPRRARKGA